MNNACGFWGSVSSKPVQTPSRTTAHKRRMPLECCLRWSHIPIPRSPPPQIPGFEGRSYRPGTSALYFNTSSH